MGTPAAPALADIFRGMAEWDFIDALIEQGDTESARKCAFSYGYIDDVLTIGGIIPPPEFYGISWTGQENIAEDVFLGAKISCCEDRGPRLQIREKQDSWQFPIIKYPHASSNVPRTQTSAIFKGQLIRYGTICNNFQDFKTATAKLYLRMIWRHHSPRELRKGWQAYLRERWPERFQAQVRNLQRWFTNIERSSPEFLASHLQTTHKTAKPSPSPHAQPSTTHIIKHLPPAEWLTAFSKHIEMKRLATMTKLIVQSNRLSQEVNTRITAQTLFLLCHHHAPAEAAQVSEQLFRRLTMAQIQELIVDEARLMEELYFTYNVKLTLVRSQSGYGFFNGGQIAAECGWHATNWLLQQVGLAITRTQMDAIAEEVQQAYQSREHDTHRHRHNVCTASTPVCTASM